ncbi:ribonuclease hii [Cystoisospora suis]|uniref:Ribonuclease n=1 Tax=Cystoisospora suis TaxID=483139 RepID=A0A2C6LBK9_9APIC|nr:ribonuclease hii [Cystoisospora suis]
MLRRKHGSQAARPRETSLLPVTENELRSAGYSLVVGADEAGRGPLAGPVVAVAVCLPPSISDDGGLKGVYDSKQLSAEEREKAYNLLVSTPGLSYAVETRTNRQIDEMNILQASLDAMASAALRVAEEATANLSAGDPAGLSKKTGGQPSKLPKVKILLDGNHLPEKLKTSFEYSSGAPENKDKPRVCFTVDAQAVVKGDSKVASIAAASIIAKVTRDRLMDELHLLYPIYDFATHKGYPTPSHVAALRKHGPCREHRASFQPLRGLIEKGISPHPYDSFRTSSQQGTTTGPPGKGTGSAKSAVGPSMGKKTNKNSSVPAALKAHSKAAEHGAVQSSEHTERNHKVRVRKTIAKKSRAEKLTSKRTPHGERVRKRSAVVPGQAVEAGTAGRLHASQSSRSSGVTRSRTGRRTNSSQKVNLPDGSVARRTPDTHKRRAEGTKTNEPKQRRTDSRAAARDPAKGTDGGAPLPDGSSQKFADRRRNAVVHSQESRERLAEALQKNLLDPLLAQPSPAKSRQGKEVISAKKKLVAAPKPVKPGAATRRRQVGRSK